jgi:ATP-binding cassette subfamily B protein
METEHEIQKALAAHLADCTVFIIAHRISSVRHADQIVVLSEGRIIEHGTHNQLMALQGSYFDVFVTQAGLSAEEIEHRTGQLNDGISADLTTGQIVNDLLAGAVEEGGEAGGS